MYINLKDNCEYNNPSESLIKEIGLTFLDKILEDKFKNCKFPKVIIENYNVIDIIEYEEKNNIADEIKKLESLIPTEKEIEKAENKIEIINILKEVGLIE